MLRLFAIGFARRETRGGLAWTKRSALRTPSGHNVTLLMARWADATTLAKFLNIRDQPVPAGGRGYASRAQRRGNLFLPFWRCARVPSRIASAPLLRRLVYHLVVWFLLAFPGLAAIGQASADAILAHPVEIDSTTIAVIINTADPLSVAAGQYYVRG